MFYIDSIDINFTDSLSFFNSDSGDINGIFVGLTVVRTHKQKCLSIYVIFRKYSITVRDVKMIVDYTYLFFFTYTYSGPSRPPDATRSQNQNRPFRREITRV